MESLLKGYEVILASRSPRRQQLLHELGVEFKTEIRDYDESYPEGLGGEEIARYVSKAKAGLFRNSLNKKTIVITADTIVWCNGKVLGKPLDEADAFRILAEISGNTHEVITGVTVISEDREITFTDVTSVTFSELSNEEIEYYVSEFKPFDKAGAYGIQEWIGIAACSRIEGSYFNVVGLPVHRLYRELQKFTV